MGNDLQKGDGSPYGEGRDEVNYGRHENIFQQGRTRLHRYTCDFIRSRRLLSLNSTVLGRLIEAVVLNSHSSTQWISTHPVWKRVRCFVHYWNNATWGWGKQVR